MGNKKSKQTVKDTPLDKPEKLFAKQPFELSQIVELPFYIQTPPILKGDEVIFLYTNNTTKKTKYTVLNLNDNTITHQEIDVECNPDFDIFNTVYALNENNNKIYFIENNKDIYTLDLKQNKIISLNKSIRTTRGNYAAISFCKGNLYIIGGEQGSDLDHNYIIIPYSTAIKRRNRNTEINSLVVSHLIKEFGHHSRVVNISYDGFTWISIMGGQTINSKNMCFNKNIIWRHVILSHSQLTINKCINSFLNNYATQIPISIVSLIYDFYCIKDYNDEIDDYDNQKLEKQMNWKYNHLPSDMNSNGVINYENRFLFLFGGMVSRRRNVETSNLVYVLALKDNEYNLNKGGWYEITSYCLPQKEYFHAIYNGGKVVHLFSYSGFYYTLNIQDILNALEKGAHFNMLWIEMQRAFMKQSTPIINMGTKQQESI